MAPWDIDSARPADDDIISQFPANERNSRSQIEGWMDYEHDKTTGRHKIPAGTTATRDGITEFVDGALWINTSFTPARLQMRVSGAWKDVGAGFAGDASIEGTLTIVGSAATRLIVERTGNANNSTMEFKTTDGSMFAGRANDTYFAIGSSNNLNTSGNRWFEVAADHARVRGNFFATGTITGDGSGLTNLNASNLSSGTLPNARLSGNYSFGSLTLSGGLNFPNVQVNPDGNGGLIVRTEDNNGDFILRATSSGGATRFQVEHGAPEMVGSSGGWSIAGNLSVSGTTSGTFSGNGSGLTNLNASNISSGTLNANRLPNHSADLLTSGTLPAGRLSGNYSFGSLTLSGSLTASGSVTSSGSVTALGNEGVHYGDGTVITIAPGSGNSTGRTIKLRPRGSGTSVGETSIDSSGNLSVYGTISGNGSGLTNLNANNISSGTLSNARLSGDYSFSNLTLSGGLSTNHIRVGADTSYVINRNTTNSWLELEGGTGGGSSSRILLYGPNSSNGRGDLRHGDTVRLRWGNSSVQADNGAGGLSTVATVYTGSGVNNTTFPVGHVIWGIGRDTVNRNASGTVRISADNNHEYDIAGGSGTALSGTWRSRGRYNGGNVMQRTA